MALIAVSACDNRKIKSKISDFREEEVRTGTVQVWLESML